jgi:hypothetical protein
MVSYCRRHKFAFTALLYDTQNCCVVDVSNKHTEGNGAFTLQQWLRDRAIILPYRISCYCKSKHIESNKTS